MHNSFEVLESKCKKYHMKKMLRIAVPVLVFLAGIVGIIFYLFSDNKQVEKIEHKKVKEKTLVVEDDVDIFQDKKIETKEVKPLKKEEPIVQVKKENKKKTKYKDVEYNLHMYSYNLLDRKKDNIIHKQPISHVKSVSNVVKKEIKRDITPKINLNKKIEPKNNSFSIVLKNLDSTEKMIKIYNEEKTYSIALKIAKLFYKQKDYKKAVIWSKKANSIEPREEEAWLVYAKSEYALGHKKRAKAILKIYINNSNSQKAKELLVSWIKRG